MIAPDDNPKTVYSIQHLRGVAAAMVLMRHTAKFTYPQSAFPIGQAGVDIFFVISGIVIYLTSRNLSWHVFLRRRLARIAPLYWLATAIALLSTVAASSVYSGHGVVTTSNIFGAFFFVPAYDGEGRAFPPIVAGWTLNFEMYFYAICVLILAMHLNRWFIYAVTAAITAGIALGAASFWAAGDEPTFAPAYLLLPITIEFVIGMWLARAWLAGFRTPLWLNVLLVSAAVVWLIAAPTAQPYTAWRPLSWGIPAIGIVWAGLASESNLPLRRFRLGLLLGDSSYALYLTHPIALAAGFAILAKLHIRLPPSAAAALAITGCLTAGVIVHRFVELPLVRGAGKALGLGQKTPAGAGLDSSSTSKPAQ